MKNFFKKINVLGLALILVGSLTIGIQSAFTKANSAPRYYFYDNDGTTGPNVAAWHVTPPAEELGIACESDDSKLCSAEFSSPPTSTDNLIINNSGSTLRTLGEYQ